MSATRPAGCASISSTSRAVTSRVSIGWKRTPRSASSTGENRCAEKIGLDQIVKLRRPQHRVAQARCGQGFLDAQLGLVVRQRDTVDPDDRDVDDVRDAGPARRGDEVVGGLRVLVAGALGGAVHDDFDAVERGVKAFACV